MRRRISIAAAALVALLAVAGVAYAVNDYTVKGSAKPAGKGTASNPAAKREVTFEFGAKDSTGARATPVKRYTIIFQGFKSFAKFFSKCSFAAANDNAAHHTRCRKARVGGGVLNSLAGSPSNTSSSLKCDQLITLYNSGRGFFIRLDGSPSGADDKPPAPPTRPDLKCPLTIARAIDARFKVVRYGGVISVALIFNVPPDLQTNSGLDISVLKAAAKIRGGTEKVKIGRKTQEVSILSSTGCKGKKRTTAVEFTDRTGDKVTKKAVGKC